MAYEYENETDFTKYSENFAPALQKEHTDLWAGKFSASRRLMGPVQKVLKCLQNKF